MPHVQARYGEQRPPPARLLERRLRGLHGLVAVGEREHDDRRDEHQSGVGGQQRAPGERAQRQLDAVVGRAAAVRPFHGRRRLEHAGARSAVLDARAVLGQPGHRLRLVGAEVHDGELERLQRPAQVEQLGRQLRRGVAGHLCRLRGGAGEHQRAREHPGRQPAGQRVAQQVVGLPQVDGRRPAVHEHLGGAQLEENLHPAAGLRRLGERAPQVGDRALGRALVHRRAAGLVEELRHPHLSARRGQQQMRRHLLALAARVEHGAGRAAMPELALAGRQLVVDGVTYERVDEAERRVGPQDLRSSQRARRFGHAGLVESGQSRDHRQPRVLPEHGHGPRHLDGLVTHAREAKQHRARHGSGPDLAHELGVPRVGRHPVRGERGEKLPEQERIAARRLVARRAERGVRVAPEALAHEISHPGLRERTGPQPLRGGIARDLAEQRGVGPGLARAQRGRQEDRRPLEPAGEIGEEAQRGTVAPLEVVHREEERPLGGEVEGEPVEPVQRGEGILAPTVARVGAGAAEHSARAVGRPVEGAIVAVGPGHRALEELAHHPEGEVALELAPPRGEHAQGPLGRPAQAREQPGLADAGRSLDDQKASVTRLRRLDKRIQSRQLVFSLKQLGLMHEAAY